MAPVHVIVFVTAESWMISVYLSDTVGLISHLCTVFNGWVKEETEALQSRAGLSPWEPKSAPGHLLTCLPLQRTCSSHYVFMFTDVNTISHFLIYTLCFLQLTSCVYFLLQLSSSLCFFMHNQVITGHSEHDGTTQGDRLLSLAGAALIFLYFYSRSSPLCFFFPACYSVKCESSAWKKKRKKKTKTKLCNPKSTQNTRVRFKK